MSLYDRLFRPRRYTLSDGTVVEEKRSRAPLVILILVLLTAVVRPRSRASTSLCW